MECLADTNIAARRVLIADPLYSLVRDAVDTLLLRSHLLSLDPTHFRRFREITVVEPHELLPRS